MKCWKLGWMAFGLALGVAFAVSGFAQSPIGIDVRDGGVTVSGVTPGGSIALVAVGRGAGRRGMISQYRESRLLADENGDGTITYRPAREIPDRSVWLGVDLIDGRYAIGASPEFVFGNSSLVSSLRKDAEGELAILEKEIPRLTVLLVRPKSGAWLFEAREGGAADHDGPNGRLQLFFSDAIAIEGKDNAPKHLKNGDVVLAVDPYQLSVFAAEVGK